MRFGIGRDFLKDKQSDYVLSQWSQKEKSELIDYKPLFNQIVRSYVIEGIGPTMNKFNKKWKQLMELTALRWTHPPF